MQFQQYVITNQVANVLNIHIITVFIITQPKRNETLLSKQYYDNGKPFIDKGDVLNQKKLGNKHLQL